MKQEDPGLTTRFLGIEFFETVTEEVEGKRNLRVAPENNKRMQEIRSLPREREGRKQAASVRNKKKTLGNSACGKFQQTGHNNSSLTPTED